jgi:hypothetical protein
MFGRRPREHCAVHTGHPAFDCTAVSTYDNVPGIGSVRAAEVRKALGQIGRLLNSWFLNAKRLFHLLIALAFMFLTMMGASVTYSEWESYRKAPDVRILYFTTVGFGVFTVFLAILCLYSFAKARSVR